MTKLKKYHFIGINGIGMSALARILSSKGHTVTGSDCSDSLDINKFKELGITAYASHEESNISSDQIIIISSAIKKDNIEYKAAVKNKCEIIKRGKLLADIATKFKTCVAVAGTHGKTTTTSLIQHIFKAANLNPSYFVGGHLINNDHHGDIQSEDIFITEVDESDGSFLDIKAHQAIITNIEQDHLDFYKDKEHLVASFESFIHPVAKINQGKCAINLDDTISKKLIKKHPDSAFITYGIESKEPKIRAEDIEYNWSGLKFSLIVNDNKIDNIQLGLFGKHNVYNALSAISIAMMNNIPLKFIIDGLSSFKGVGRRLELKYKANDIVLYDDYAHHPTEIMTTLEGLYKSFSTNRIITIFQPHRYSRLTKLFGEFSKSFHRSDKTLIVPVFKAGESQGDYKTSADLVHEINQSEQNAELCESFEDVVKKVGDLIQPKDIILIMGAGNISSISKQLIPLIQRR